MQYFNAPWSRSLTLTTATVSAFCLAVSLAEFFVLDPLRQDNPLVWLILLPVLTVVVSLLFTVRGYSLAPGRLGIQRLLWQTRLPLQGLQSARHEPAALERSLRLFGNGGLFSYTGVFRSAALGRYRAYLTDHQRAVVLRFAGRTLVVSPEDPAAFVQALALPAPA